MPSNNKNTGDRRRPGSWGRLTLGLCAFAAVLFFFTRGVTPPGEFGEVVRHNQAAAIDATPYFYTEVENIVELQAGLDLWRHHPDSVISIRKNTIDSSTVEGNPRQQSDGIYDPGGDVQ